jgi:hypothetical protein
VIKRRGFFAVDLPTASWKGEKGRSDKSIYRRYVS